MLCDYRFLKQEYLPTLETSRCQNHGPMKDVSHLSISDVEEEEFIPIKTKVKGSMILAKMLKLKKLEDSQPPRIHLVSHNKPTPYQKIVKEKFKIKQMLESRIKKAEFINKTKKRHTTNSTTLSQYRPKPTSYFLTEERKENKKNEIPLFFIDNDCKHKKLYSECKTMNSVRKKESDPFRLSYSRKLKSRNKIEYKNQSDRIFSKENNKTQINYFFKRVITLRNVLNPVNI